MRSRLLHRKRRRQETRPTATQLGDVHFELLRLVLLSGDVGMRLPWMVGMSQPTRQSPILGLFRVAGAAATAPIPVTRRKGTPQG